MDAISLHRFSEEGQKVLNLVHGVMVTQLILIQSFKVRALMDQRGVISVGMLT